MAKNATPASPATARASKVFPVPGAPMRRTPFGISAPMSMNFLGFFKKSTISESSCLASLAPATSLKVTLTFLSSGMVILALDWPKDITCIPAPRIWRVIIQMNSARKMSGTRKGASCPTQ